MTKELTGKVALVTGGGRGIGAAIARALADAGADVAISYANSAGPAEQLVTELEATGVRAAAFRADQAKVEEATGLIGRVAAQFGKLDILVNNAGVLYWGTVGEEGEDLAAFDRQLAINYINVVAAIRAAVPHLGEGGRIISLGSGVSTRVGATTMTDYAASKSALVGFSKGLARDLAARGITVNVVQAGHVDTDMNPADGPFAAANAATSALGRYGHPEEIAYGVVALASPRASYITGAVLPVDGGYLA
ncbi:MAG TPA: SDR family oxidoreductase [Gryllotalpicola sp.]